MKSPKKFKGIQNITFNYSRAPKNAKEIKEIQSSNNQDHFCFMWCVYCFEKFLLLRWRDGKNFINSLNEIETDYINIADKS